MAIWSGAISFGLVNIPGSLESAQESEQKLSFKLEDKHDHSPVGYKYYNKTTGKDVERKDIIKTYEFEKGKRVEISNDELKSLNLDTSQNIEIENFVAMEDIDPLLFERPYYIVPKKGAEKSYHLLRRAMEKTKMAALGQMVIRQKNHLALMFPRGDYILLELLRYPHTVIEAEEADYLKEKPGEFRIAKKELDMAVQLVKSMQGDWNPGKYRDTYYEEVMKLVDKKIKGKKIHISKEAPKETMATNVRDIMPLLRKSLEKSAKAEAAQEAKKRA